MTKISNGTPEPSQIAVAFAEDLPKTDGRLLPLKSKCHEIALARLAWNSRERALVAVCAECNAVMLGFKVEKRSRIVGVNG